LLAGGAAMLLDGTPHDLARYLSWLALAVWALEELMRGVNSFRRLLGLAVAIVLVVRVVQALQA
jgi:hypothetical protein